LSKVSKIPTPIASVDDRMFGHNEIASERTPIPIEWDSRFRSDGSSF